MTSQDYQHNSSLRESIAGRLSHFEQSRQSHTSPANQGTPLISAAVAIAVSKLTNSQNACIYLTKRSTNLRKHAGQYALPGGKADPGETYQQAALRELSEELGLRIDSSQILGTLDDFSTRSGFVITPVVVWDDSTSALAPNPDEVAQVFEIPLQELINPDLISLQETDTTPILSLYVPSIGNRIYSPTAAIIYQFREVGLLGRETRVSHYEQPGFAWR